MWRERMRNALTEIGEGREQTTVPPPRDQVDALNDAEIATGIGTPLADAAARADHLLSEIAGLYARVGDRPFVWNESKTTTMGVLRTCYTHPRLHMSSYYDENGDPELARVLFEDAVADMRAAGAPDLVMAIVLYKLASMRVREKRGDDAITLLREAIERRPDTRTTAASDPDFEPLRGVAAFQELTTG